MNYLIDQQHQLDKLAPQFAELAWVSVDTEFLREKTYSAKLCLVQLGIGEDQYCIDVLAIPDLSALTKLLINPQTLKVFHAASQDLEVLYQQFGNVPRPIFDTQLAAAFSGADLQISYAGLVEQVTGVSLDKGQSRTDWTRRPLSDAQVRYAGEDVEYLRAVYDHTYKQIVARNRIDWFHDELALLCREQNYQSDPSQAYLRLSGGGLARAAQYRLKAMAQWREQYAQQRDIPRTWVIKDTALYEIATANPNTPKALLDMGVLGPKSGSRFAPIIVNLLRAVEPQDEPIWRSFDPLTKNDKKICQRLMQRTAEIAEEQGVAQALLGTRKDIEILYRQKHSDKLLNGWRRDVVGVSLLAELS